MFTRFQTSSAAHVLAAPLIKVPPETPGAKFLSAIGSAYEDQEEHLRSRLLQLAANLEVALQRSDMITLSGVEEFLVGLRSVTEFLHSVDDDSIQLYSYERAPSIDQLIDAYGEGAGSDDWVLEELAKKGEKGRKGLLSVLKKEQDKRRIISIISILMIVFQDTKTITAIQKFIDNCETDIGKEASVLLVTYTSE